MNIDEQLRFFEAAEIPFIGKPYIIVELQAIPEMEIARSKAHLLIAREGRLTCRSTIRVASEPDTEAPMPDIRAPQKDVDAVRQFLLQTLAEQAKGMAKHDLGNEQERAFFRRKRAGAEDKAILTPVEFQPCELSTVRDLLVHCLLNEEGRRAYSQLWKVSFTTAIREFLKDAAQMYENLKQ